MLFYVKFIIFLFKYYLNKVNGYNSDYSNKKKVVNDLDISIGKHFKMRKKLISVFSLDCT